MSVFSKQECIIYYFVMWGWFRAKKELDLQKTYLRVQFLTAKEKSEKQEVVKKLQKKYQNDQESIVPYQGSFSVSFRFTFNTTEIFGMKEPLKNKMQLKELINHLQITKNEELQEFIHTYVKEMQMYIQNGQMIGKNEVIPLFNEVETSVYRPEDVLQIIYEPRTVWERIKNRGKNIIKNLPKLLLTLLGKIAALIFSLLGIQTSATSLIFKFLPTKSIMHWLLSFLTIFFPMLAPFLTLGSKYIG